MVAHTCNPSTFWGGQCGQIAWAQEFKTSPGNMAKTHLISTKNRKISQVWWHMPMVLATCEAEVGGSLEPGRWRLQWALIVPLHSSLGDRAGPYLKNKIQNKKIVTNKFVQQVCKMQNPYTIQSYFYILASENEIKKTIPFIKVWKRRKQE